MCPHRWRCLICFVFFRSDTHYVLKCGVCSLYSTWEMLIGVFWPSAECFKSSKMSNLERRKADLNEIKAEPRSERTIVIVLPLPSNSNTTMCRLWKGVYFIQVPTWITPVLSQVKSTGCPCRSALWRLPHMWHRTGVKVINAKGQPEMVVHSGFPGKYFVAHKLKGEHCRNKNVSGRCCSIIPMINLLFMAKAKSVMPLGIIFCHLQKTRNWILILVRDNNNKYFACDLNNKNRIVLESSSSSSSSSGFNQIGHCTTSSHPNNDWTD